MNRFTDTEIWNKPWFRKLKPSEKEGWRYIVDHCDNVGVWVPDFEAAEFFIGTSVDWDALIEGCNENIEVLESGKWWLVDFTRFQHKDVFSGSQSNACKSYILLLRQHGLYCRFPELFEAFGKPSCSLDEGYKEKERVKVRAQEKEKEPFEDDFSEVWEAYPRKENRKGAQRKYVATRRKGEDADRLLLATQNYAKNVNGREKNHMLLGSTFFGPDERWRDYEVGHGVGREEDRKDAICEVCGENFAGFGDLCPRCKVKHGT